MRPADLAFRSHLSPERSDVDVDVILETVPDDNVTSKTPTIAWAHGSPFDRLPTP